MADISKFVGSYTQKSCDGVIDFVRKIGFPEEQLKKLGGAKLSILISRDASSGELTFVRKICGSEKRYKLKLGEKYTYVNLLGETVETTMNYEDGKLVDVNHSGRLAGRKVILEKVGPDLKLTVSLGDANAPILLTKDE